MSILNDIVRGTTMFKSPLIKNFLMSHIIARIILLGSLFTPPRLSNELLPNAVVNSENIAPSITLSSTPSCMTSLASPFS